MYKSISPLTSSLLIYYRKPILHKLTFSSNSAHKYTLIYPKFWVQLAGEGLKVQAGLSYMARPNYLAIIINGCGALSMRNGDVSRGLK